MSHITTEETEVDFIDKGLLEEALKTIGRVDQTIMDYYGKQISVAMAVHTPEFEKGIGFIKQDGKYIPQMDNYGKVKESKSILKQIQQRYQEAAVTQFYKSKRFNVQSNRDEQGIVRIHARGY